MDRYVCVHGHFYQPPRENPWLELVERQEAAYPFHDWNERITAECYGPNARARILDDQGRITQLVNNYARLSFNLGPTLLSWMKDAAPETYSQVLEADRDSAKRYGGHGSAMAQVYNHAIVPLADDRDRATQVRWGVADFRHRFGRDPEGMWLAETAADEDTLEVLAQERIRFTVLSPYQAGRVRAIEDREWRDVSGGRIDPTMPYLVRLSSGRSISVFFYDGPISQAVAFEGLLDSAERFERRLLDGFGPRPGPQLVNIATDGESYGHHHRRGEMALAATLERLAQRDDVRLTNYGEFLAMHPPTHEVEIVQPSSWSCSHGVERWRSDCGCSTGEPGRHQRWREPLRAALDELRDRLADRYARHAGELLRDPWAARDDYVEVVLDRVGNLDAFLARHATHDLDDEERRRLLKLLELQRYALLMYTSCGWFFDELSRPEPVQVLQYAARAIQLAREVTGRDDLEPAFVRQLQMAESNEPRYGNGRGVYEQLVRPAIADLEQVGAHFAISSLSWVYERTERIGAYEVLRDDDELHLAGRASLAVGRLTVRSVITLEARRLEFAVLHLGDHSFVCRVRPRTDDETYQRMRRDLEAAFERADFPAVIRGIDDHLAGPEYSLRTLFRDEQRRILDMVLATTVEEAEASYRGIFRGRAPLMRFLTDLGSAVPPALRNAAQIVINAELQEELSSTGLDVDRIRSLLEEADRFEVVLDAPGLAHTLSATIARISDLVAEHLAEGEERTFLGFDDLDAGTLGRVQNLLEVVDHVPFEVDLARAQDVLWSAMQDHIAELRERSGQGDPVATKWLRALNDIAEAIGVVPPPAELAGR